VERLAQTRAEGGEQRALTAIRGLAALWVIAFHVAAHFEAMLTPRVYHTLFAGFMGVDVFFVLSGFILALVYRDLAPGGIAEFCLKRLARLYPLSLFVTAAFAILARLGQPPGAWAPFAPVLPWYATMLESFMPKPTFAWIAASWSTGIELVCYALFVPVIFLLRRLRPGLGLLALALLVAIDLLVQQRYQGTMFNPGAFWRGFTGFMTGAALGAVLPRLPPLPAGTVGMVELCGLAGVAAAVAAGVLSCVPLAAGILLVGLYADSGPIARLLRTRVLFWQGRISYSTYLLHLPLMLYWFHFSESHGMLLLSPPALAHVMPNWLALLLPTLLFVAVVSLLATLTWRFIEQPGRRLPRLLAPRGRAPRVAVQRG
jgi:peptidoglycan/LPS O-acetylase OafA/YrhL